MASKVFPNAEGSRSTTPTGVEESGSQPSRNAGLDGLNFHDLHRTNATAMVAEGVDVKTAQARLGHSDPRLTLAIYAQATKPKPIAQRRASSVLD